MTGTERHDTTPSSWGRDRLTRNPQSFTQCPRCGRMMGSIPQGFACPNCYIVPGQTTA